MVNLYQSDVRGLSDQELETLSAELAEAYQRSAGEFDYWTDDAGETRYYELRGEIQRRWRLTHADWKPPTLSELTRMGLAEISKCMDATVLLAREFDPEFQIGTPISVRAPKRSKA